VERTDYYNVLILVPDDPDGFLDRFTSMMENVPAVAEILSRVMPATETFLFADPGEFERKARDAVLAWAGRLCGKAFHVRMHRRGFKGRMSSQVEERFLDDILLAAIAEQGDAGRIDFDDPDSIIDIETIDNRAALSFWTREELRRYPFLKPD
jgi:tRNA(Ser,Leu) C12 N-acetylase TAN1